MMDDRLLRDEEARRGGWVTLTLQILDDHRLLGAGDNQRTLGSGTLTIGRGRENDWVLPDPERVISKQHCAIASVDEGYVLTDTSSNGVFVNAATEPVGRGNRVALQDGDRIRISHFEFMATLAAAAAARPEPALAPVGAFAPTTRQETAALPDDAFLDDLLGPGRSGHAAEGSELDELLGPGGEVTSRTTSFTEAAPLPIPDESFELDPLEPPANPLGSETASAIEHIPSDQDVFEIPGAIPEDWLDSPDERAEPIEEPPPPPAAPPPAPPTAEAVPPAAQAVPPAAQVAPAPQPAPKTEESAAPEDVFLEHFLRAAGLTDLRIDPARQRETAEILGRVYREMIQGMMEILSARSSIKNEFRLTQTVIQPVENNPLKFSLNVDEAMSTLLTKSGKGYLPPVTAVQEAVDDLKAHQIAMLAGMQQALNGLLARFDPAALEDRMAREKSASAMLGGKKARYWDAFTKLYEKMAAEAEEDFHSVFGREFGKAYEEQVRRQKRRRA